MGMWVRNFGEHQAAPSGLVEAEAAGRLLNAIGEPDPRALPRVIVGALGKDLPVGHCAVFAFSEQARPRLCFEPGRIPPVGMT